MIPHRSASEHSGISELYEIYFGLSRKYYRTNLSSHDPEQHLMILNPETQTKHLKCLSSV
jgi:hypothetical protein